MRRKNDRIICQKDDFALNTKSCCTTKSLNSEQQRSLLPSSRSSPQLMTMSLSQTEETWGPRTKPLRSCLSDSAVGMAEDFVDSPLLTSAIRQDFSKDSPILSQISTESPNSNRPRRFTIRSYINDNPRKRKSQDDALLRDFDVFITSRPYELIRGWLSHIYQRISRIYSKSKHALFCIFSANLIPLLINRSMSRC